MAQINYVSLFLIVMLQFSGFSAATDHSTSYLFVRAGDAVALSCVHEQGDGGKCNAANWTFKGSGDRTRLIDRGQIHQEAKSKAGRLSVAANCSLVISEVSDEDAGLYGCRKGGRLVVVSVVTMTEHRDGDEATLNCSVSATQGGKLEVKFKHNGRDVDDDDEDLKTSQSGRWAAVTLSFPSTAHGLLTCSITQLLTGEEQRLAFRPQPPPGKTDLWWPYIIVAVVSVALSIIAVAVIKWKRAKENETRADHNASHPPREIFQTMVEPEYDVPIIARTSGGARVRVHDDENTVIYSAVVTA